MISPLTHLAKIDVEVLTVLVFLLVSFASWIKAKLAQPGKKKKQRLSREEQALRETIWRRQMGEETTPMPWESEIEEPSPPPQAAPARESTPPPIPASPARPAIARQMPPALATKPPPIPAPSAFETAMQAPQPVVSAQHAALAESFERISNPGGRRSARSKAVIAMLRRPESARQAILLQEILGPPVALRHDPAPNR